MKKRGFIMLGVYNYTVILTYLGFLSGLLGIGFSFTGNPTCASVCLLLAGLFDMFDGKIASTKKDRTDIQKGFGIQIDSLSDLVCFGVLPAAIGYAVGLTDWYFIILLLVYPLAALIRLAYFNVLEEIRQKETSGARVTYSGIPVTTASVTFPLIYFIFRFICGFNNADLPGYFRYIYALLLFLSGTGFLLKNLVVRKLKGKWIVLVTVVFLVIIAAAVLGMLIGK